MSIFKRISDIVSANFNDLVDSYEDPEAALRQAIREMEAAINSAKPDVARAMANEKTVAKELATNEREVTAWGERASTAVAAGDDALARKALGRKREYEKIVAALRDQQAAASEAAQTLRRQLEAMQAKLKDGQRRLGTLAARKRAADVRAKVAQSDAGIAANLDQNAFDKFERMERKVAMAEAEADALSELARSERDQSCEDVDPAPKSDDDLDIEAELIALKQARTPKT